MKIVSGGQTGVDRAALDAALKLNMKAGGWCPEDRLAEDGKIPTYYPVKELPNAGYKERTRQNVTDSDGTVIIYFGTPSGGTENTLAHCISEQKPYLLIDAEVFSFELANDKTLNFIDQHKIAVLNIAGPRASKEPRAYQYTKTLLGMILKNHHNRNN